MATTSQGLFLSLDGLDGSGKSTQCRLLAEWLRARGHAVTECADPGGTAVGRIIRDLLLGHRGHIAKSSEALLFMASRAQLAAEVIRPALNSGRTVVSDRYALANIVYQGYAGGLDPEALREVGALATGGLEPALTLVLDVPVDVALARRRGPADRVEGREPAYHARVREGFLIEARRYPARIRVVDATLPPDVVHQRIVEEVARVLAAHPGA
jgi:dTMP kinase